MNSIPSANKFICLFVAIHLSAACRGYGAVPTSQPDLSPKAVALEWAVALSSGDLETLHRICIGTDREFSLTKKMSDYILATQRFNIAARKKFGEKVKLPEELLPEAVAKIQSCDEKINGDEATLFSRNIPGGAPVAPLALKRINGQWKVSLSEIDSNGEVVGMITVWLPSQAAAMDGCSENIARGKYKTIEEAIKEMYDFSEDAASDAGNDPTPQATIARTRAVMADIRSALTKFKVENGRYPKSEEGIAALVANPGNLPHWENLMERRVWDPWARPYQYRTPGKNGAEYDLYSTGPSGVDGAVDNISSLDAGEVGSK